MEYYDEIILETQREIEHRQHTTLETGIYVGDELITFRQVKLPETDIQIHLPEQFIIMPEMVKDVKYPSKNNPDLVITSLDSMVNFGFNVLPIKLEAEDTEAMSLQFQRAIQNTNPSIRIKKRKTETTNKGNEMSWFDFKGYALDGLYYNRMYIVRMKKTVLHCIFNCPMRVAQQWEGIAEKCFMTIEEDR